jgi:phage-related baseplate assembly protein
VAGGIIINIDTPTIRQITVLASIAAKEGFSEADLHAEVRREIEAYIDSRAIGSNIIVAKMIDVAFNVVGVENVNIQVPTSDVVILEDELPTSSDSSGNTLVTVL